MTFLIRMTTEELSALVEIAKAAGYSPDQVEPINPYKVKGNKGMALKISAETNYPALAAKWKAESMKQVHTLETAAMEAGVIKGDVTQTAHNHLMETSHDYRVAHEETVARREAGWLAALEKGANELQAMREKQTSQFDAKAKNRQPGLNVDQGVAAWNRNMRGQMNRPASDLIR